jgi:hypothetical protein
VTGPDARSHHDTICGYCLAVLEGHPRDAIAVYAHGGDATIH